MINIQNKSQTITAQHNTTATAISTVDSLATTTNHGIRVKKKKKKEGKKDPQSSHHQLSLTEIKLSKLNPDEISNPKPIKSTKIRPNLIHDPQSTTIMTHR